MNYRLFQAEQLLHNLYGHENTEQIQHFLDVKNQFTFESDYVPLCVAPILGTRYLVYQNPRDSRVQILEAKNLKIVKVLPPMKGELRFVYSESDCLLLVFD